MSSYHTFRPVPGQCGPRGRGPLPAPPFDPQDYWATKKFVSSLFESIETKIDKFDVVDPSAEAEAGKAADAKSTYEELNRILGVASDAQELAESKADQSALEAHVESTNNPHAVTANQVGAYTKTEVNTKLNEKANKATTLSGYGITDAATTMDKSELDMRISNLTYSVDEKLDKQLGDQSISWDDSLGYLRIKNAILDVYSDSYGGPPFGIQIGGNTLFGDEWQLTSTLKVFQKLQITAYAQLTFLDDDWNEESIEDRIKRLSSLAPKYSTSSAYTVGQYVFHDGSIYRCTTAIALPGEAWNPSHWSEAQKLDDFFTNSNSLLTGTIDDRLPIPISEKSEGFTTESYKRFIVTVSGDMTVTLHTPTSGNAEIFECRFDGTSLAADASITFVGATATTMDVNCGTVTAGKISFMSAFWNGSTWDVNWKVEG